MTIPVCLLVFLLGTALLPLGEGQAPNYRYTETAMSAVSYPSTVTPSPFNAFATLKIAFNILQVSVMARQTNGGAFPYNATAVNVYCVGSAGTPANSAVCPQGTTCYLCLTMQVNFTGAGWVGSAPIGPEPIRLLNGGQGTVTLVMGGTDALVGNPQNQFKIPPAFYALLTSPNANLTTAVTFVELPDPSTSGNTFALTIYSTEPNFVSLRLYQYINASMPKVTINTWTSSQSTYTVAGTTAQVTALFQAGLWLNMNNNQMIGRLVPWEVAPVTALDPRVANITAAVPYPIRGLDYGVVSVAFNLPTTSFGNEIWIQFPAGYQLDLATPAYVVGLSLPNNTRVLSDEQTIQLRWNSYTPLVVYDYGARPTAQVWVSRVGLPNNCNPAVFTLTTHSCYDEDLLNAGLINIHRCYPNPATDLTITGSAANAVPTGCTLCNACKFAFLSPYGDSIYSCEHNGKVFTRLNVNPLYSCASGLANLN